MGLDFYPEKLAQILSALDSASDEIGNTDKRNGYKKALQDVGLAYGLIKSHFSVTKWEKEKSLVNVD